MGSEEKTKKKTWEVVSQWKTQWLRRCRERQSLLRHCVVSDVEELKDSEGKSRKRIWGSVSNGEFTEDADAVKVKRWSLEAPSHIRARRRSHLRPSVVSVWSSTSV